jgi:hypothetical protein
VGTHLKIEIVNDIAVPRKESRFGVLGLGFRFVQITFDNPTRIITVNNIHNLKQGFFYGHVDTFSLKS